MFSLCEEVIDHILGEALPQTVRMRHDVEERSAALRGRAGQPHGTNLTS